MPPRRPQLDRGSTTVSCDSGWRTPIPCSARRYRPRVTTWRAIVMEFSRSSSIMSFCDRGVIGVVDAGRLWNQPGVDLLGHEWSTGARSRQKVTRTSYRVAKAARLSSSLPSRLLQKRRRDLRTYQLVRSLTNPSTGLTTAYR